MLTVELQDSWEELKEKIKQKFAKISDKDLLYIDGKKEEMMDRLQIKLGKSKEELSVIIKNL